MVCGEHGNQKQTNRKLWLLLLPLLGVTKSFVTDPGVSCLFLASTMQEQAEMLPSECGKIRGGAQFLTRGGELCLALPILAAQR